MRRTMRAARLGAIAGLCMAAGVAHADPAACDALAQRWAATRVELQTPQVSALLFNAADNGCAALAEELLAGGALLEAKDRFGNTPLGHAARAGQVAVLRALLAHGAEIGHRNLAGSAALFLAIERRQPEAAIFLLDHGADARQPGRSAAPPLAAAAFAGLAPVAAALLAHGAEPGTADATGKPPIVYAAARGAAPIVAMLLDAGVDVNARHQNDLTALIWAAGHADEASEAEGVATVELLLSRGARLEDADNRGRTALMTAAERGHAAIARALLAHGAAPGATDRDGKAARDLAADAATRAALGDG